MHSHNIVHRDIKPENILVEKTNGRLTKIMVIDLGTARRFVDETTRSNTQTGTGPFMAPEVRELDHSYKMPKVDVYSAGKTILLATLGYYPGGSKQGLWEDLWDEDQVRRDRGNSPLVQIALAMINPKPELRLSVSAAMTKLAHACPAECVDRFSSLQREELLHSTRMVMKQEKVMWAEAFLGMNTRSAKSVSTEHVIAAQLSLQKAQRALEVAQQSLESAVDGDEAPAITAAVSEGDELD